MAAVGVRIADCGGPVAGADARWRTPLEGLMVGATYTHTDVSAPDSKAGPYPFPINVRYRLEQVYGQFEKGKLTLSGEWRASGVWLALGPVPESYGPGRSWYAMGSYHATSKLTAGAYYQRSSGLYSANADRSDPANYLNDVAVNCRFDFNRFLYLKLEGHDMQGNLSGFYPQNNPNGYQKNTRLLAVRVGFML